MAGIDKLVAAVIEMEGSMLPNSINMNMVRNYGRWNVGHLVWAGQRGATPIYIKDRNWASWSSQAEATAGLQRDLLAKASRGMSIRAAFEAYAPAFENDTENYIAWVSAKTGYPPDTPLSTVIAGGGPASPLPSGTVVASGSAEYPSGTYGTYDPNADGESGDNGMVIAAVAAGAALLLIAAAA
jgi:hypothetical protein